MRSIDLITKINHLTDADEIFAYYRSLRQDELVWQGYQELSRQEGFEEAFASQGQSINPGTLALYALDPAVKFDNFQANVYSHELFESIMLGYEDYITGNTPVSNLQQAAKLALALLEKHKLSGEWTPVLTDILNRMKLDSAQHFRTYWGTPIAILANLTEKRKELSNELLESSTPQLTLEVFLLSLLCQPLLNDDLLIALQGFLAGKPAKLQSQALKSLQTLTDRNLVQELAARLLVDYQSMDLQPGESRIYWENPETSTEYALKCQSVADLAELAGDYTLALKLAGKSVEIMNAISAIARIKQSALVTEETQKPGFSEMEMSQQEVRNELAFTNQAKDLEIEPESPVYAVKLLSQSKRMKTAGNDVLASNEISGIFSRLTDEEIEKTLVRGPRFSQTWESANLLTAMVNSGDYDEAIRMAQIMLRANPSSKIVNFAAAKAFVAKGQFTEAVEKLEFLNSVDPKNSDVKRLLVQAYVQTNCSAQAYTVSKELIANQAEPKVEDILVNSKLAIEHGDLEDAKSRLAHLLEIYPQNSQALTLTGKAHYQAGDYACAEESFIRATEISDAEVQAWVLRSEILARQGEGERAIEVLKQGLAANPGNHDLQRAHVMLLMAHGKLAEAYPVLRELSREQQDHEVDVHLILAMKSLGIADFADVIEMISTRYPDDLGIQGEYGRSLILTGEKAKGLAVLKQVKQGMTLKPDWALAFLEARLGVDHARIQLRPPLSAKEQTEVIELFEMASADESTKLQTGVLKGEFFMLAGQSKKAFDTFSDLVDLSKGDKGLLVVRILAGLAESAAQLEKLDIAKASIFEALERQPDWDGLIKIKSEIMRQSGAIEDAYKTARFSQSTGPVYLEKLDWFTGFLKSINREEEAQIELKSALEANPDDVGIQLLYAEQIQAIDPEESAKTLLSLKDALSRANNPAALRKAAVLFERQGSHDQAEECLRKSADLGDDTARLNLAGYYRREHHFEEVVHQLNGIELKNDWTALFLAETYFSNDEILKAYQNMPAGGTDLPVVDLAPEFLPAEWTTLMDSSSPITRLSLCMDLKSGVQSNTLQMAREWVNASETVEAHVFALETALAAGDLEAYDHLVHSAPVLDESMLSTHFQFLRIENALDGGNLEEAGKLLHSLNESEQSSLLARFLSLRCDRLQANRRESEQAFEKLASELDHYTGVEGVQRLAAWRNGVKAAISLDLYQDAIEISQKALLESNANHAINLLSLQSFVLGIEFRNACIPLDVTAHLPFAGKTGEELSTELSGLSASFGEKHAQEIDRIVRHGRLAIEPTQDDLRALAVITPDAWDAAAMMSGLRATGQVNLARQIARKFMEDPQVCFVYALCNEQDTLERAIEVLNASLMKNPDQPLGLTLISRLLEGAGEIMKAAAAMEEANILWTNEVNWQVRAADLWTKLGSQDRPVVFLESAHHLNPDDEIIQEKLGKAYLTARKPQQALEFLEPLVRQDAQRIDLWMDIADAHTQAGNLEMALLASERTCELAPDSSTAHLLAARVNRQRGDLSRAIEEARTAVSNNGNDPEGHVFLAGLHLAAGDKLSALESLEHASRCPDVSVRTLIEHAELMREINGDAAARDLIKSFSRRYPENPELLSLLAQAEETCGNLKQAELAAKKVLDLSPEESGMTRFLGRIQQKSGNLDQAAYFYSQVIAHDPQHAEDYLELSKIFIQQREFEKARKVLEDGIQKVPGCIDLYLACAVLLKEAKDYRGAEAMLRSASAIDPRNLAVQRQLGAVLALNLVHRAQEVSTQQ